MWLDIGHCCSPTLWKLVSRTHFSHVVHLNGGCGWYLQWRELEGLLLLRHVSSSHGGWLAGCCPPCVPFFSSSHSQCLVWRRRSFFSSTATLSLNVTFFVVTDPPTISSKQQQPTRLCLAGFKARVSMWQCLHWCRSHRNFRLAQFYDICAAALLSHCTTTPRQGKGEGQAQESSRRPGVVVLMSHLWWGLGSGMRSSASDYVRDCSEEVWNVAYIANKRTNDWKHKKSPRTNHHKTRPENATLVSKIFPGCAFRSAPTKFRQDFVPVWKFCLCSFSVCLALHFLTFSLFIYLFPFFSYGSVSVVLNLHMHTHTYTHYCLDKL